MTKTITSTGLIKFVYHDQVWFERPGYEVLFTRMIIHKEVNYEETHSLLRESSSSVERNR